MNSSIHTYISKCLKNLKNLPSCSISYKVLLSEYSFKKSASNISDFEEQCSYGKKIVGITLQLL